MTFLLLLERMNKSHNLGTQWTSQTKSINLPAALPNPHCPPIMIEEVSFNKGCPCMLFTPPLQGTSCLLVSCSFSSIFILILSLPFPFPSLTLHWLYTCSNMLHLKFCTLSSFPPSFLPFMSNVLKILLLLMSFTFLFLLYFLTS